MNLNKRKIICNLDLDVEKKQKHCFKRIYFDIESSGFQGMYRFSNRHKIIQLAAVDEFGNKFDELVSVDVILNERSTAIHNFTNEDLNENGINIESVLKKFYEFIFTDENGDIFLELKPVLIAHNCYGFDMFMLIRQIREVGVKTLKEFNHENIYFFDTLKYLRENHTEIKENTRFNKRPYNLENLHKYLFNGEGFENAHNAFADVNAMIKIVNHLNVEIGLHNLVKFDLTNYKDMLYGNKKLMIEIKGIKKWRANIFSNETNKIKFFYRRNWENVTIEDVKHILFKDKTMYDIEYFLREKIRLSDDNEILEILFAICDKDDLFEVVNEFPFCRGNFGRLNLSESQHDFLKTKNIFTINGLIECSLFDEEVGNFLNDMFLENSHNKKEYNKHKQWILDRK